MQFGKFAVANGPVHFYCSQTMKERANKFKLSFFGANTFFS